MSTSYAIYFVKTFISVLVKNKKIINQKQLFCCSICLFGTTLLAIYQPLLLFVLSPVHKASS